MYVTNVFCELALTIHVTFWLITSSVDFSSGGERGGSQGEWSATQHVWYDFANLGMCSGSYGARARRNWIVYTSFFFKKKKGLGSSVRLHWGEGKATLVILRATCACAWEAKKRRRVWACLCVKHDGKEREWGKRRFPAPRCAAGAVTAAGARQFFPFKKVKEKYYINTRAQQGKELVDSVFFRRIRRWMNKRAVSNSHAREAKHTTTKNNSSQDI